MVLSPKIKLVFGPFAAKDKIGTTTRASYPSQPVAFGWNPALGPPHLGQEQLINDVFVLEVQAFTIEYQGERPDIKEIPSIPSTLTPWHFGCPPAEIASYYTSKSQ
jgi:hypothetical protein